MRHRRRNSLASLIWTGSAGLGLAICRQIVQRHNGRISVEADTGARFVVRLPLPISPPTDLPAEGSSPPTADS